MNRIIDNFSQNEKIKNFDILIENYYDNNFGRLSKADFELLMDNSVNLTTLITNLISIIYTTPQIIDCVRRLFA